jgi:hypothetical protein
MEYSSSIIPLPLKYLKDIIDGLTPASKSELLTMLTSSAPSGSQSVATSESESEIPLNQISETNHNQRDQIPEKATSRTHYTEEEKREAIREYFLVKNYRKASRNLGKKTGKKYDESSILLWCKENKNMVAEIKLELKASKSLANRQIRDDQSKYPDMEEELVKYIRESRAKKEIISKEMICKWPRELCDDEKFVASNGCFGNFLRRKRIAKRASTHIISSIKEDSMEK